MILAQVESSTLRSTIREPWRHPCGSLSGITPDVTYEFQNRRSLIRAIKMNIHEAKEETDNLIDRYVSSLNVKQNYIHEKTTF